MARSVPFVENERAAILLDETTILPEVVRAGAEILLRYDLDGDLPTDVARWVFCAMYDVMRNMKSTPLTLIELSDADAAELMRTAIPIRRG